MTLQRLLELCLAAILQLVAPEPPVAQPAQQPTIRQHDVFRATQTGPFDTLIADAADDFGVDPWVLKGLLLNESNLNPKMRCRTGVGIASFVPAGVRGVNWIRDKRQDGHEHERFTMRQAMMPEKAIPAVAEYVAWGIRSFGSVEAGLAFYNGGFDHARKVRRYGYRGAKRRGLLLWCKNVRMSGIYVENVLKKANVLRAQAGLPPLDI